MAWRCIAPPVEEGERADLADELAVEEEVLPDGEVLDEGEVLVDGLDSGLAGVLGGGQLQLGAVEDDGAGVGVVDAADAADEGGLAGAVVADQRGDLSAAQRERDVLEGLDAAEGEGDVCDLEQEVLGGWWKWSSLEPREEGGEHHDDADRRGAGRTARRRAG